MKQVKFLLMIVLIVVAVFAVLNWPVFIAPTDLSLGVTTVQMPLGLLMLGLTIFISLLFALYVLYLQSSALFEARRQARELRANKALADQAEASRLAELRAYLEDALTKQARQLDAQSERMLARVEQLDADLRMLVEQTGNSLAASVGELEDRVEKAMSPPAGG